MTNEYIIENKVFKEVYETSENICTSLNVIKEYCENHQDIYELSIITPIIKFIFDNADKLFAYFINKRYAEKGEKTTFHM